MLEIRAKISERKILFSKLRYISRSYRFYFFWTFKKLSYTEIITL